MHFRSIKTFNQMSSHNFCDRPYTQKADFQMTNIFAFIIAAVLFSTSTAIAQSSCLGAPPLPNPTGNQVHVSTESALQSAVSNLSDGTTIIIAPGNYQLTSSLYIRKNNVTIRGLENNCNGTTLTGKGMENQNFGKVPHGIWTDATNLRVQNLTIRSVFHHPIQFDPKAESPHIYNVRLLDAGEQFIKGSSGGYGAGVDDGIVEFTIMEYLGAPPNINHGGGIGYTNGVDIHGGRNWIIRNNLFKNFHTPDSAQHRFNPAVLMWNGAQGTITERNTFINVDRAIAHGLINRGAGPDHRNGIIRNNFIYQRPGLFSSTRRSQSDGLIISWHSPNSQVVHNTILTNNNSTNSIQFRFDTGGSKANNNLSDANIRTRNGGEFTETGNFFQATNSMFIDPNNANLHLKATATSAIDKVAVLGIAPNDIDSQPRPHGVNADIGADEYDSGSSNNDTDAPAAPQNLQGLPLQ